MNSEEEDYSYLDYDYSTYNTGEEIVTETVEKKTVTVTETVTKTVKKNTEDKKERLFPDGQKVNENEVKSNFKGLVTRDVMIFTRRRLEEYLVLIPKYGLKVNISGMILHGPNGTGKTVFCENIIADPIFYTVCDFEWVDVYELIDAKMGKSSENVAMKFKEWIKTYQSKKRVQVKIIDEGELVFLSRKQKNSMAYRELSNSMLKHTGKFNGTFIILLTNSRAHLDKGAISRFEQIYWSPLNKEERINFMRGRLENSEIKVNMDNFDEITPYLDCLHYSDIRTHTKLMSYIQGWYVRNHNPGDQISISELAPIFIEFNHNMEKEQDGYKEEWGNDDVISPESDFEYPDEIEMIDFLVENGSPKFKSNYVKLKEDYEQFGLRGNQLDGFLKPAYKTAKKKFDKKLFRCR